jgi:hypothetical protein
MTTRYLFLCPDSKSASGGIAVIYDVVSLLNGAGYDAAIVHNAPSAGYPDYPTPVPAFYTRRMRDVYWRYSGLKTKFRLMWERWTSGKRQLKPITFLPSDVIVAPEFQLAEAIEAFDGWPIVVFVQNPFSLMASYHRASQRGFVPQRSVKFWLGIADVCRTHLSILGLEPSAFFPVSMKPHEFPFQQEKQKLITYMPRKRPIEAMLISEALKRRGNLQGYQIEALDNIPRSAVAEKLKDSRIFISLLHQEALGFPAAEAMAAGCIVVGYDGLGTAEYFDSTVGVPVTEGDVAGLVEAIERIIAQYETNPAPFEAMRKKAAVRVTQLYSMIAFEDGLIKAWEQLHKSLTSQ